MRISDWSSDVCSSDLHANFEPKTSTSGAQYDVDIWKLQAGVDGSLYDGEAGRLIGGISGHYGTISSDIASRFGDGSISSTGHGLGGTLTWYANNGFYLDRKSTRLNSSHLCAPRM